MDDEDRDRVRIGGLVCLGAVIISGIVIFALAFDTLTPTQVGLKFDQNFMTLSDRVYNNGRYFLGIGCYFIKFPVGVQVLEFKTATGKAADHPLRSFTKEGQIVTFDAALFFRLERDKVGLLYKKFGSDWYDRFNAIAIETVKETVTSFSVVDFFTKRDQIGSQLQTSLRLRFRDVNTFVEMFHLRAINIPSHFEDKIVSKVVTAQQYQTEQNVRDINVMRAYIEVLRGQGNAQINRALSVGLANANATIANAEALGQQRLRIQEAVSYQQLANGLGMKDNELLRYRWSQVIGAISGTTSVSSTSTDKNINVMVGFSSPTLSVSLRKGG